MNLKFDSKTLPREFSQRRFTILTYKTTEELTTNQFINDVKKLIEEHEAHSVVVEGIIPSGKIKRIKFKMEKDEINMESQLRNGVSETGKIIYNLAMAEFWIEDYEDRKKIIEYKKWLSENFTDLRSKDIKELEQMLKSIKDKIELMGF